VLLYFSFYVFITFILVHRAYTLVNVFCASVLAYFVLPFSMLVLEIHLHLHFVLRLVFKNRQPMVSCFSIKIQTKRVLQSFLHAAKLPATAAPKTTTHASSLSVLLHPRVISIVIRTEIGRG
jgi:type IV secretory pathway VirB3-like protein